MDVDACLGGDLRCVHSWQTDDVLNLLFDPMRISRGQVDLVQNRQHFQIMLNGQIGVGQCLCFHPLTGVHHQHSAFTGGQTAADFIVKVHMTRSVDQI